MKIAVRLVSDDKKSISGFPNTVQYKHKQKTKNAKNQINYLKPLYHATLIWLL